ncbi:hypothetical protein BGZ61DRAFT_95416 [Ilyonectria robusta]|uniref:uncharacterized protein n=1 Tax=Ilyonectria robusta TaxID=1079257 RepID=UPI001E8CE25D|nr:uncharacterized protein BGZ61DRAFT_95416 [Ilyonectria robusta]KAH8736487.1 hypothetical protein BGZ61DRAFT_95416 [Ilyonectria robusta]
MESTGPGTGYDTKHQFRYVLAQGLALWSGIDTSRQPQSADKVEYFRHHLGYNGPWRFDTRKNIGKIAIFLFILALALDCYGINLTLGTTDLEPRFVFEMTGSSIGAAFLWRRGSRLWDIRRRIRALETEIEDDEGDIQMHEIKSLAEKINFEALAVFFGGSERATERWRFVSDLGTGSGAKGEGRRESIRGRAVVVNDNHLCRLGYRSRILGSFVLLRIRWMGR